MVSVKHLCALVVLSASALSFAQDKIKIEPKWDKDTKLKLKLKGTISIGGGSANIDTLTTWTGEPGKDGYSVNVHHDQLAITMNDMEIPVQYNDFKVGVNAKGSITSVEGGVDGSDGLRFFLVTSFLIPDKELTKDAAANWGTEADAKLSLGARKIVTTYLGSDMVGKTKAFKFSQVMSEDKTDFSSTGTFWVTAEGHVLQAEVEYKGLPIPAGGGDATGKFKVTLVE